MNDARRKREIQHIHPIVIGAIIASPLREYLIEQSEPYASVIIRTRPIAQEEIKNAIGARANTKSVGGDRIDADVIKKNSKWIIPIICNNISQNRQRTNKIPKKWLKGVVTYIHKKKIQKQLKTIGQ